MGEFEEETKSQKIPKTKSLDRSQSLPFLFPQQSNDQGGSAIKTLANQHLRDLETMHDQHTQDMQAVQDQHDDLMSSNKREMKEAEKKNARMIAMLDKLIECQDNHIKYQNMELRQHEVTCQQEKEKRDMEMKEIKDKKDMEVKEMREIRENEMKEMKQMKEMKDKKDMEVKEMMDMRENEMKEMRAVHDAKVLNLEAEHRLKVTKLEKDKKALQQENRFLQQDKNPCSKRKTV